MAGTLHPRLMPCDCFEALQVVLQKRASRGYLMGFADLNLGGAHDLYVMYKFDGRFYEMNGALTLPMHMPGIPVLVLRVLCSCTLQLHASQFCHLARGRWHPERSRGGSSMWGTCMLVFGDESPDFITVRFHHCEISSL
jgi:hypothetical protein